MRHFPALLLHAPILIGAGLGLGFGACDSGLDLDDDGGPPAGGGVTATTQRPSGPAVAVVCWPARVTVIGLPGSVQPQRRLGWSRWSIMCSPTSGETKGSLAASAAKPETVKTNTSRNFFMGDRTDRTDKNGTQKGTQRSPGWPGA